MTTVNELVASIRQSQTRDAGSEAALAHLTRSESSFDVPETTANVSELVPIYRRRLRRLPPDVVGLTELVDRLTEFDTDEVLLAVHADRGRVTTVVRSKEGALVACVVGPDRREDPEHDQ